MLGKLTKARRGIDRLQPIAAIGYQFRKTGVGMSETTENGDIADLVRQLREAMGEVEIQAARQEADEPLDKEQAEIARQIELERESAKINAVLCHNAAIAIGTIFLLGPWAATILGTQQIGIGLLSISCGIGLFGFLFLYLLSDTALKGGYKL